MESDKRRQIDWRSPHVVALFAAVAVAAVAVPAWAQSDDGLEDELSAHPAPPGVTPRAPHAVAPPPGGFGEVPAGVPDGAAQRGDFVVPVPPPPGAPGEGAAGEGPPGPGAFVPPPGGPFPLSDEQIEAQRESLERFVDCMAEQGVELGEPEVGRYEISIPLPEDAAGEGLEAAERECGGPPLPPLSPQPPEE